MKKQDCLYKYTKLIFLNSTLNNGIFASSIYSLNDPYECKDIINNDDYRVVCMSRSRNKKLMWSHYADGHRGCSIKISVPEDYNKLDSVLRRVRYISKIIDKSITSSNDLINALYAKDKKWDYELEVRAVYCTSNSNLPCWKKYRNNIFYKANVIQVDFGCYAHLDEHYLDALIALRDYNSTHKKQIKVRKYKMSDKKFEFILDKTYNYIDEINRIIKEEETA